MKHRQLLKKSFIWLVTVALASTMSVGLAAPTASAQGESASATVLEPQDGVTSIAVKTAPTKTTYVKGESFDPTGLEIAVTFTGGGTPEIIAYTDDTKAAFSFDKTTLAATDTAVIITYGGKTVALPIVVAPVSSLVVKAVPKKISYIAGDAFVADGLVLAATYENGTTKDIVYSPTAGISFDKSTLSYGDTAVAIAFGGKTVSMAITVAAPAKNETVSTETATYEVKSTSGDTGTVAYTGATDAAATAVNIPAAVDINGVTYKVTSVATKAVTSSSVVKVTVGSNVTTISPEAFYKCKNLKTVTAGSNVKTISSKAFYKCKSLKTVTLSSKKLKTIGKSAFYGCKNLKTVTVKSTKLTEKSVKSSLKSSGVKIVKVPKSKVASYKKIFTKANCGRTVVVKRY